MVPHFFRLFDLFSPSTQNTKNESSIFTLSENACNGLIAFLKLTLGYQELPIVLPLEEMTSEDVSSSEMIRNRLVINLLEILKASVEQFSIPILNVLFGIFIVDFY